MDLNRCCSSRTTKSASITCSPRCASNQRMNFTSDRGKPSTTNALSARRRSLSVRPLSVRFPTCKRRACRLAQKSSRASACAKRRISGPSACARRTWMLCAASTGKPARQWTSKRPIETGAPTSRLAQDSTSGSSCVRRGNSTRRVVISSASTTIASAPAFQAQRNQPMRCLVMARNRR